MSIAAIADGLTKSIFQVISTGTSQAISIGATSTQSSALTSGVSIVRLFSTVDCWISIAANPTAVVEGSASFFLPGGVVEYFQVSNEKIAVIQATSAGKLYITEGANV